MRNLKKVALILSFVLMCTAFSGCGQKKEDVVSNGAEVILNGKEIYPVKCEDSLTYWTPLNPNVAGLYENFGDTPLGKELEKLTGIKVEYIHGQRGQEAEQFNILIASNELPDMTQYDWGNKYPGGGDKAVLDEYIIDLKQVFDFMPNFTKIFDEKPDDLKKIQGDSGAIYTAPLIRSEQWMAAYMGMIYRKDWLDACNLETPKTVDELEEVLYAFKEKYNCAPLVLKGDQICSILYAYNTAPDFYLQDGNVKYGYVQPEYKKSLERLNKWYKDGLLDQDYLMYTTDDINKMMLNGKIGVIFGAAGSGIGTILNANPTDTDPSYKLVPGQCLTTDGSDIAEFGLSGDTVLPDVGTAITKNCKNYELAARWLDFGYSEKGHMLNNFGIEGLTYDLVNDEPVLTDLIKNNPDGKTLLQAAVEYMRSPYNGSFVQDARYVEQSLVYPEQKEGYELWAKNNMADHLMPPVTLLAEELDEAADIKSVARTYVDEMQYKFISGEKPIAEFDEYVAQLEEFGLPKLLQMYQNAYERYLNR